MSQEGSNRRWTEKEVSIVEERFPTTETSELAADIDRSEMAVKHKARRLGINKAENWQAIKKIDRVDTPSFDDVELNNFISGFVAGEGCFTYRDANDRDAKRFAFQISVADVDSNIIEEIKDYLGVGNIYERDAREENWKPTVQYQVQSIGGIGSVIIPFFDEVGLRDTNKEKQYQEWRREFVEYHTLTERFK